MTDLDTDLIARRYEDAMGNEVRVPEATRDALRRALGSSAGAAAPLKGQKAWMPDWLAGGGKAWGVAVQLYAVRSARNWGIGDFTDLAAITAWARGLGADYVGLNPLHALFPASPAQRSPYYPSSRLFLNPLYIDPEAIPGLPPGTVARPPEAAALSGAAGPMDYHAIAAAKLAALEAGHAAFVEAGTDEAKTDLAAFTEAGGTPLRRHATFDALHEHFAARGVEGGFSAWPEAYRRPDTEDVARFASERAGRIGYFCFLQWVAATQLKAAARASGPDGGETTL